MSDVQSFITLIGWNRIEDSPEMYEASKECALCQQQ